MTWGVGWPYALVRITHEPSGFTVRAEGRSQWRARAKCFEMLRGKLWAFQDRSHEPEKLIRSYDICADLITDERTGETRSEVQAFLDGKILKGRQS